MNITEKIAQLSENDRYMVYFNYVWMNIQSKVGFVTSKLYCPASPPNEWFSKHPILRDSPYGNYNPTIGFSWETVIVDKPLLSYDEFKGTEEERRHYCFIYKPPFITG